MVNVNNKKFTSDATLKGYINNIVYGNDISLGNVFGEKL